VKYASSRGKGQTCSAAEAIRSGIAVDGGLFVPIKLPSMDVWTKAEQGNYVQLAAEVLGKLLTDYTASELEGCAAAAYADNFDSHDIVPLIRVGGRFVLELWHGPTSAFKDMALQIMPRLLTLAMNKTGETSDMLILVATSGDTGKAALEGFRDVPGTNILVFYPSEGVSEVQRRQMITQEGQNVGVVAVEGNFDDAQTGVKKIFADNSIRGALAQKQLKLSSANSINWGRLAPQIAYYFSAYQSLCAQGAIVAGDSVNFCVPTGNFGNILAGYYAKRMGLPINRLICASNDNNVLTEFLRTGIYDRNRSFHQTISPSMDILISSNLERLLYHVTGGDTERVRQWMTDLNARGRYEIDAPTLAEIHKVFWADWASENDSIHMMKQVWETDNYLLDPHTAVAWKVADSYAATKTDGVATVVLSTASPFKFADSVLQALGGVEAVAVTDPLELLKRLEVRTGWKIPTNLANLSAKSLRHQEMCQVSAMPEIVLNFMDKLKALKE
jgi:threonine synthase